MAWHVYLAYFAAGLLLANGVPHFVQGISGNRFAGWSAIVNSAFGLVNFAIGYVLIWEVGKFDCGFTLDMLMVALGITVAAVGLAWYFAREQRS